MNLSAEELKYHLESTWLRVPSSFEHNEKVLKTDKYIFISYGRIGPFSNWIINLNISENDFENTLAHANKFFSNLNTPYSWMLGEKLIDSQIEKLLINSNHSLLEEVECMAFDLNKQIKEIELNNIVIKRAETLSELEICLRLDDSYSEYSEQQFQNSLKKHFLTIDKNIFLFALVDDKPVAMTSIRLSEVNHNIFSYFSGATTLPEYRNKGIYSALTNSRLKTSKESGLEWAAAHAVSDTSAPILRKNGFETLSKIRVYSLK